MGDFKTAPNGFLRRYNSACACFIASPVTTASLTGTTSIASFTSLPSTVRDADAAGLGSRDPSRKAFATGRQAVLQPAGVAHVRTGRGLHRHHRSTRSQQVPYFVLFIVRCASREVPLV